MANGVTVKISNAQDYTPHAALLADDETLGVLLEALGDLDPARTSVSARRLAGITLDVRKAREALKVVGGDN